MRAPHDADELDDERSAAVVQRRSTTTSGRRMVLPSDRRPRPSPRKDRAPDEGSPWAQPVRVHEADERAAEGMREQIEAPF